VIPVLAAIVVWELPPTSHVDGMWVRLLPFLRGEFLFRDVLLPKMDGVLGPRSRFANGVPFGFYHLHQAWGIPGSFVSGALLYALPSCCFRSTWLRIIVHSAQSVYFALLILGIVLGLA
jgi:uncharacterized protein